MYFYKLFSTLFLFSLLFFHEAQAQDSSAFGRYIGTLKHEKTKQEQFAKIDFIVERNETSELRLKAILTLHFGDFSSQEYISYHFHNVQYNLLTQTLVFDQADQDVRFSVSHFQSGKLEATLKSDTYGTVGTLLLNKDNGQKITKLTYPLIEPVQGVYEGSCENKPTWLRLYTYRSTGDTTYIGNPFGSYETLGFLSEKNSALCVDTTTTTCVVNAFEETFYNFYSQDFTIIGDLDTLKCKKVGSRIDCGKCSFQRITNENIITSARPLTSSASVFDSSVTPQFDWSGDFSSLSGEYRGYLHHEFLNTYQEATLDLSTFQKNANGAPVLALSAVAQLFFGSPENFEALTYRFDTIHYPNPLQQLQLVLARPEGDGDAVLRITSLQNGIIKGEWYSLLFGRVGKFELRKEGLPHIATPKNIMTPLSGEYDNGKWFVHLRIGTGRSPMNTSNPFYPLQIDGYTWNLKRINAKDKIFKGSYDFYTGKFALIYGAHYSLIGSRLSSGQMSLSYSSNAFGVLAQDFNLSTYNRK